MSQSTTTQSSPEWDGAAATELARTKVQTYLLRETEISIDQRNRIAVDRGSTRLWIEFFPQPEKRVVYLTLTCAVAYYVPVTPDLFEYLARNVDKYYFGHLAMSPYGDDSEHTGKAYIYFTDTLIADFLDPPELTIPVFAMLSSADALDDEVIEKLGGERYREKS